MPTGNDKFVMVHSATGRMLSPTASRVSVRGFNSIISDEPPSRQGGDLGPTPLEFVLVSLCAAINVATARVATAIGFQYDDLEVGVEAKLDTRGRLRLSDIPKHYQSIRVNVRIHTAETRSRLEELAGLVDDTSAVISLVKAAIPDYEALWDGVDTP